MGYNIDEYPCFKNATVKIGHHWYCTEHAREYNSHSFASGKYDASFDLEAEEWLAENEDSIEEGEWMDNEE